MKILFVNTALVNYGGTECYLRDVAYYMKGQGHIVSVCSPRHGVVARDLRDVVDEVVTSLDDVSFSPDLIHGHHAVETTQAALYFSSAPVIHFTHGVIPWEEGPPAFLPNVQAFVCVSEVAKHSLHKRSGGLVDDALVTVVPNFVDENRFVYASALEGNVRRRALFLGSSLPRDIDAIRQACDSQGIALDEYGPNLANGYCSNPEALFPQYSIFFGYGRSAMEALFCGLDVILCCKTGSGPIVTSRNFDELRVRNFGYTCCPDVASPEEFAAKIVSIMHSKLMDKWGLVEPSKRFDLAALPVFERLEGLYFATVSRFREKVSCFGQGSLGVDSRDSAAALIKFLSQNKRDVLFYRKESKRYELKAVALECELDRRVNELRVQRKRLRRILFAMRKRWYGVFFVNSYLLSFAMAFRLLISRLCDRLKGSVFFR